MLVVNNIKSLLWKWVRKNITEAKRSEIFRVGEKKSDMGHFKLSEKVIITDNFFKFFAPFSFSNHQICSE